MEHTVDVSKPVHNPELVEAINKLREEGSGENQNQVLVQVMRAHLLAPIDTDNEPVRNEDGTATFHEDTMASFAMLVNAKGENFFPAFTDWDELHKWKKNKGQNQKAVVFSFTDYASIILSEKSGEAGGFVVNPFGGNLTISKELILALLKEQQKIKAEKVKISKEEKIHLGKPNKEPTELINAIIQVLKCCKQVKSARLLLKMDEERITKSWLLVLEFKGEEQREVYDLVAAAVNPYLQSMYIDMISLQNSKGMEIEEITKPFYERKRLFGQLGR